ncbi:unnamed protein product [Zymoseptoria tritici ST99CH_1E4]|uniref:Uncharacterized protein n=1 Tax=Zymoseptoria tritici ST99CH_1E4 TaxID=1276532 RepID=A0A2H1GFI8_ZYMTR|nr:unnamed protein product [Zymoseptoria tritici ST99CH_1E4]
MPPPFDFSPSSHAHFLQMGSNVDPKLEPVEATSSQEPYFAQSPFGYQVNIPCTKLKDAFCSRKPVSNMSRMVTDVPRSASQVADADESDKASKAELERQLQAAQDAQQTAVQQRTKDAEELQNRFEERIARFKQQAKDQDKKRREEITKATDSLTQANAQLSTATTQLEKTRTDLAEMQRATEVAEKKANFQMAWRDLLKAKIAVVQKAVLETPNKSIKEVWEVADKARPALSAAAKPVQRTSADPAAIDELALNVPSSSGLRTATANSAATAESITNPILHRMKVNVFVTTPHDCDGTAETAKTEDESVFLAAARSLEAFPRFPGVPMKKRVRDWTDNPMATGEASQSASIFSAEDIPANILEGAKVLASAAVWRYMMPTRQHIDIIIKVTHDISFRPYQHEHLQTALFKHVNDVQTRMLDWLEVRMYRFVEQTGGHDVWKNTTAVQRMEAYSAALKQYPVSIFTGLLGADTAAHLDLGSVWGKHGDVDLAQREHCDIVFVLMCEFAFICTIEPMNKPLSETSRRINRTRFLDAVKTLVYDEPASVTLEPRLGGLGDIPFLGFRGGSADSDVAALMTSRIAGSESDVSKLFVPPPFVRPDTIAGTKRKHADII